MPGTCWSRFFDRCLAEMLILFLTKLIQKYTLSLCEIEHLFMCLTSAYYSKSDKQKSNLTWTVKVRFRMCGCRQDWKDFALVNALPMIVISRWCVEKLSVRSEAQWARDFFACLYWVWNYRYKDTGSDYSTWKRSTEKLSTLALPIFTFLSIGFLDVLIKLLFVPLC